MSAPNAGRQSPSPSRQAPGQQSEQPAGGQAGAAPSETHAKDQSEDVKDILESNPKGPLEDAAKAKISKEGRGEGI